MPHTYVANLVHCVFSTKNRANLIAHPDSLCRYMTGIARNKNIALLAAGGTANHLHLLVGLPASITLARAMQDLKGNCSRMLNEMGRRFAWQEGHGAFSVSSSQKDRVAEYIAKQETHHRRWTFEQEFVALLEKRTQR